MDETVKIAIIGPGKIAPRFVKGARFVSDAQIIGVYGRTKDKAICFAKTHKIDHVYTTLDELLLDDNVDLVYVATPPQTHRSLIEACLNHNKHVLCEKPMLFKEEDIVDMVALAKEKKRLLMEAQKAPYLQTTQWIKQTIAEGKLGDIVYVEASYGYDGSHFGDDHWAFDPESGGSLWDVGVYPIAFFLTILDDDIVSFSRSVIKHTRGSDAFGHLQVQTKRQTIGSLSSSLINNQVNTARVYGTKGMVLVEDFWKSTQLTWVSESGEIQTLTFDDPTDFAPYIAHAVSCIKKGLYESPVYHQKHWLEQVRLITSK